MERLSDVAERARFEARRDARKRAEAREAREAREAKVTAWQALTLAARIGTGEVSPSPRDLDAPMRGYDGDGEAKVRALDVPRVAPLPADAARVALPSYVRGSSLTRARHAARFPSRLSRTAGDARVVTVCSHRPEGTCRACEALHALTVDAALTVQRAGRALRVARKTERRALAALRDGTDYRDGDVTRPALPVLQAATKRAAVLEYLRAEALTFVVMPSRKGGEAFPTVASLRACNVPPDRMPA